MKAASFITFQKIPQLIDGRKLVFFGAGGVAEKTFSRMNFALEFILDNNSNFWNTVQLGVTVFNPCLIEKAGYVKNEYLIIICTTSYADVGKQLENLDLVSGVDFVISPILNDLRVISDLESIQKKLLFTSGLPSENSPNYGGGVYELLIDEDESEYRKIYSGISYGILKHRDHYVLVDDNRGLVKLDESYNIIQSAEFELGTRAHGIAYSEKYERFYVVASYMDRVLIFDNDFSYISHIPISDKYDTLKTPVHHCNDICVIDDSLYVSMFSFTGNYKNDIFDGVVLEIDIPSNTVLSPVINNLWMPHNISVCNGCLTVLDSLRGGLRQNNAQEIGCFPGFTRGLDTDGEYYYIGQSKNRNYSKTLGISKNISIDTAIIIFDEHTKISRSIQFSPKLSEIHSILLI